MSITSLKDALEKRLGKPCPTCNEKHQGKCARGDLVFRIENLLKANSLIPGMMSSLNEAVSSAESFQKIVKQADEAHTILMEVLASKGPLGELIKEEYLGRLGQWAMGNQPTNQDISVEQADLFDPAHSMLEEKQTNDSTKQLTGENSPQSSLPPTLSATPAEKDQRQSITLSPVKDV